jgi:hypothetical protein
VGGADAPLCKLSSSLVRKEDREYNHLWLITIRMAPTLLLPSMTLSRIWSIVDNSDTEEAADYEMSTILRISSNI